MTKDPVCEMNVNETEAMARGLTAEHHCQTHYFCSAACRDSFEANPGNYLLSFSGPADQGQQVQRPA